MVQGRYVFPFSQLRMTDVDRVGGKNASLGELLSQLTSAGIRVPDGFATTAEAFRLFLKEGGLEERIAQRLTTLDVDDVKALAAAGAEIRGWIEAAPFPAELEKEIREFYEWLKDGQEEISVAVRSSATAEDLPDASFAGQQETVLNVVGIDAVFKHMKEVFASLYNDRAISYRVHKGFTHAEVALSAGVQRMCRSDRGAAGVMFTLDTESGFDQVVFITASYGLGETVVQGAVNPDEFYVHKPILDAGKYPIIRKTLGSKLIKMEFESDKSVGRTVRTVDVPAEDRRKFAITDEDVIELARFARIIEKHYGRPMDIEWGKDGNDGKIYILQARPETVKSQQNKADVQLRYTLKSKGRLLCQGRAIGQKIGTGPVRIVDSAAEMDRVQAGDVLVTDMTDPNWEPVMKKASAIVTNRGGRTCHAAIIARSLNIPGITQVGEDFLKDCDGREVILNATEGECILDPDAAARQSAVTCICEMQRQNKELNAQLELPNRTRDGEEFELLANCFGPEDVGTAMESGASGVGLLRSSYMMMPGHAMDEQEQYLFYTSCLAAAKGKMVTVRTFDFGADRTMADAYQGVQSSKLGLRGIRSSLRNMPQMAVQICALMRAAAKGPLRVMFPMVTNIEDWDSAMQVVDYCRRKLAERGVEFEPDVPFGVMLSVPAACLTAEDFTAHGCRFFVIGTNDLTQYTHAVSRELAIAEHYYRPASPAMKKLIAMVVDAARKADIPVTICGLAVGNAVNATQYLRLGLRSFSMSPQNLLTIKKALRDADAK